MPSGTRSDPFELRVGATDRFYQVAGAGFLDSGDAISTAPFTCPSSGVTIGGEEVNSAPLSLDGVTYAANEVASCNLSGIALHDLVEVICTITTTSGRTDLQSMWVMGVHNYS